MQTGELRDRITVKGRATTTDVAPGKTVAWATTIATVWASVKAAAGREQRQADAMTSTVPYDVVIRYRTDVTPAHRITWGSKTLQIHSVADLDGQRTWLLLACTETA